VAPILPKPICTKLKQEVEADRKWILLFGRKIKIAEKIVFFDRKINKNEKDEPFSAENEKYISQPRI